MFPWVGSVLYSSCTTSHDGRSGSSMICRWCRSWSIWSICPRRGTLKIRFVALAIKRKTRAGIYNFNYCGQTACVSWWKASLFTYFWDFRSDGCGSPASPTPRTYQTDHTDDDLNHLVPRLPLWEVAHDLRSTDRTPETSATIDNSSRRLHGSHPATWAVDHTDHTDHTYHDLSALKDLVHEVGIDHTDHPDHLSELWNIIIPLFPEI